MRTRESLMSLVGQRVTAPIVQSLVATDGLTSYAEPDFEEGEAPRSYLSCSVGGYQFCHTDGRVNTLFVYLASKEEFQAFRRPLIAGLSAGATRTNVRQALGQPTRSGEPCTLPILGPRGAWDRYDGESVCLHFAYTDQEERVQLITVMTADIAP
jgi:hypothetical protein